MSTAEPSNSNFGTDIRELRLKKGLTLRELANAVQIDVAILSKIETGKRNASRQNVIKLARYFEVDENELLSKWITKKLKHQADKEDFTVSSMKVEEKKVDYLPLRAHSRKQIITRIAKYLERDDRVIKAWIFGSFARGDEKIDSDIDLMLRFDESSKISLFDLADIQYNLEGITGRKLDIAEEGTLYKFAQESADKDLKLIYER
jgi:predicted nucleotidyltransferase/DNA-binding XRE family transcriptional regulator